MDYKQIAERLRGIANDSKDAPELRESIEKLADELYELVFPQERWDEAVKNAKFMLDEYKKIPSGAFGATVIATAIARYERGERTKELLEELEGIEYGRTAIESAESAKRSVGRGVAPKG